MKYFLLLPSPDDVGGVLDELQWMSLLRSAGAYQMFRQSNVGDISPEGVAAFLLLNPLFPRSVRYCLERIHETLQLIGRESAPGTPDDLECRVGLTQARWSYTKIDKLIAGGLHEAIDGLQQDLNELHNLIHDRYFVLPGGLSPEDDTVIPVNQSALSTTASDQDLACTPA